MHRESNFDIQKLISAFERLSKAEWRKQPYFGIKNSEVRTLLCIKNIANEGSVAITVSAISHRMFVTSPSVTQIIKNLDKNGYVNRTVDSSDKRFVEISLTEKGEKIVQKVTDYMNILFTGLIDELGEEQCETLLILLDKVCNYLDHVEIE